MIGSVPNDICYSCYHNGQDKDIFVRVLRATHKNILSHSATATSETEETILEINNPWIDEFFDSGSTLICSTQRRA